MRERERELSYVVVSQKRLFYYRLLLIVQPICLIICTLFISDVVGFNCRSSNRSTTTPISSRSSPSRWNEDIIESLYSLKWNCFFHLSIFLLASLSQACYFYIFFSTTNLDLQMNQYRHLLFLCLWLLLCSFFCWDTETLSSRFRPLLSSFVLCGAKTLWKGSSWMIRLLSWWSTYYISRRELDCIITDNHFSFR